MAKAKPEPFRAVVLFNGTSNDDKDQALTNVVRMRDGLVQDTKQMVVYCNGVGNDQEWWGITKWISLLTGYGAGWVMKQAYKDLTRQIDERIAQGKLKPSDTLEISVGGFSRGAAIARHFANEYIHNELTERYKGQFKIRLDAEYLFDTVGAFGIPFNIAFLERLKIYFQEIDLGWNFVVPLLTKAYHAVSLDEKREAYTPKPLNQSNTSSRLHAVREEVYFEGDHSSVGGSYKKPAGVEKLSDRNPLHYMVQRARKNGLRFNKAFIKAHHLDNPDKVYELGHMFETDTSKWPSTQIEDRALLTNVGGAIQEVTVPLIALSAYRRMETVKGYRPKNLDKYDEVDVLQNNGTKERMSLNELRSRLG